MRIVLILLSFTGVIASAASFYHGILPAAAAFAFMTAAAVAALEI